MEPYPNAHYTFNGEKILFDDGTEYTLSEAFSLARDKLSSEDMQAIHLVKKRLSGLIYEVVEDGKPLPVVSVVEPEKERGESVIQQNLFSVAENEQKSLDDLLKDEGEIQLLDL